MYPIVVHTYPYRNSSIGLRACHFLVHQLNKLGVVAYSSQELTNPEWNEPVWRGQSYPFIAVYPEVVGGNPFDAKYVVRWLLNFQGRLGGPKEYSSSDLVFAYNKEVAAAAPRSDGVLWLTVIESSLFYDSHVPSQDRSGTYYWIGKGVRPKKALVVEITGSWPATRAELADLLQHASLLISYDDFSGLNIEALLCGCPVILEPGHKELNRDEMLMEYYESVEKAPEQLVSFVEAIERRVRGNELPPVGPLPPQVVIQEAIQPANVLLVRFSLGRELVRGPVTGKDYVFYCRANICASPVDSRDVPAMLEMLGACCGQSPKKKKFHVAYEGEAIRWYRS